MLKAIFAFLSRFIPEPDFESNRSELQDELQMRKLKVRMMIEGRML